MPFFKKNFFLTVILALSFIISFIGVNYNLPLSTAVVDEIVITSGALKMLAEKTPILSFVHSNYFPLSYYLYLPFLAVYIFYLKLFSPFDTFAKIKELGILHTGNFLIVGRMISVLLGTASVFLIYLIAQKLFKDKKTSLIASLLFALSPLNVAMAHFARVWTIQIFFILLATYFALKIFSENVLNISYKKFIVLGILMGFAFASNIIGLLIYIPIMALIYFSCEFNRTKNFLIFLKSKKFLVLNIIVVLIIAATYFLNKTSFVNFLNGFLGNVVHGDNFFKVSFSEKWTYYFKVLFKYETMPFLLAMFSFPLIYRKDKKIFFFLLSGFFSFFFFLGPLGGFTQARYSMPMIPFLIFASAYLIKFFWDKKNKTIAFFLIAIAVFPSSFLVYKMDKVFLNNGSDIVFYSWMLNNIPNNSRTLFINNYFLQDIILTKDSINRIKKFSPDFYSSRMAYLLDTPTNKYNEPAYDAYQDTIICNWPKEEIINAKFDYIIATEGILNEISSSGEINLCGMRKIKISGEKIIYQSSHDIFFNKEDPILGPIDYFNNIKKLGLKFLVYKL